MLWVEGYLWEARACGVQKVEGYHCEARSHPQGSPDGRACYLQVLARWHWLAEEMIRAQSEGYLEAARSQS